MKKCVICCKDCSILDGIGSPIEGARYSGNGEAWAVEKGYVQLNSRQQALLDKLPEYDSRVTVKKGCASMTDLAALTAKTKVEYAMFTKGRERLVVRGDSEHVNIDQHDAAELNALAYKWSGHTHVGDKRIYLLQSVGDVMVLREFNQPISVIYNSAGDHKTFGKR